MRILHPICYLKSAIKTLSLTHSQNAKQWRRLCAPKERRRRSRLKCCEIRVCAEHTETAPGLFVGGFLIKTRVRAGVFTLEFALLPTFRDYAWHLVLYYGFQAIHQC
jgi:hypothetical protein